MAESEELDRRRLFESAMKLQRVQYGDTGNIDDNSGLSVQMGQSVIIDPRKKGNHKWNNLKILSAVSKGPCGILTIREPQTGIYGLSHQIVFAMDVRRGIDEILKPIRRAVGGRKLEVGLFGIVSDEHMEDNGLTWQDTTKDILLYLKHNNITPIAVETGIRSPDMIGIAVDGSFFAEKSWETQLCFDSIDALVLGLVFDGTTVVRSRG